MSPSSKHTFLRTNSLLRKRRRSLRKQKHLNIQRAVLKRKNRKSYKKPRGGFFKPPQIRRVDISAGNSLSIFGDTNNVIRVVNLLDRYSVPKKGMINRLHLDLTGIQEVDIGALSFLLAKANEIANKNRVFISGDLPNNTKCKQYIHDSGFLDYMTDLAGRKFERQSDNFLIRIGGDVTENERVGSSIKKCIKALTGTEAHYEPVYSIIQEMCGNSVEHANIANKNWLLGMNYTQDTTGNINSVTFTMTDVGFGVLKTIKRKWGTAIKETFSFTKETDILSRAFEKKYGSSTQEVNRNRGLPLIKYRFEKRYIFDLKIVTNNVLLDFENADNSKVLGNELPGTFYCWKIDKNCIDRWKNKN